MEGKPSGASAPALSACCIFRGKSGEVSQKQLKRTVEGASVRPKTNMRTHLLKRGVVLQSRLPWSFTPPTCMNGLGRRQQQQQSVLLLWRNEDL